jgi:hypothetical protein
LVVHRNVNTNINAVNVGYTQVNINVLKSWLGGKNEFIFHVILRAQVTTVSTDF